MFKKQKKVESPEEVFLCNQVDLWSYPDIFELEFKKLTRLTDRLGDNVEEAISISRRVIAMTPLVMKQFVNVVSASLKEYEKKYGEIKLPKLTSKKKKETGFKYIG